MVEIRFRLNGVERRFEVRAGEALLTTLRERAGVTSLKDGCAPQGQCGCCLALVAGVPKLACVTPVSMCAGREVTTLEGLPEDERARLAAAFVGAGGLQCGFCTPGLALRAKHLLGRNPSPTRGNIATAIDGHLCRCTGYVKVVDAVEALARAEPVSAPLEGGVGARAARHEGEALTLGARPFVSDMTRPGLLHAALVFASRVGARVEAIDVTRALAAPGVRRVATAADVPGQRLQGLAVADWPALVAVGEATRFGGDVLAIVAADDEAAARSAAALVEVTYAPRPPMPSEVESVATAEDSRGGRAVISPDIAHGSAAPEVPAAERGVSGPRVNAYTAVEPPGVATRDSTETPGRGAPVTVTLRRGDATSALAASAHVVTRGFETPRVEHLFLEPECALAEPSADGLRVYSQGSNVFDDRRQVASLLGWPDARVRVEGVPSGGAFGGRQDATVQLHAALMSALTGRPVRVRLTREDSVRLHPKRHPMRLEYTLGCDADGRLTALRARLTADAGAYRSSTREVLERAVTHACGPYRVPHVDVEAVALPSLAPPSGAMRGAGAAQTHFAMEGCVDALADALKGDAWALRKANLLAAGDAFGRDEVVDDADGLAACLDAVKPAWDAARASGEAAGLACAALRQRAGEGATRCRLVVERGSVALLLGCGESGQGLFTQCRQLASEVSGLPMSVFEPRATTEAPGDWSHHPDIGLLRVGPSVVAAARLLRAALDGGKTLAQLEGSAFDGEAPGGGVAWAWAAQVVTLDGDGRLSRVVAAQDVGRALNPQLSEGQVEGSVHMGLGWALSEALECEGGAPTTSRLRELGALRARDMPTVEVHLVESASPAGPFGAKDDGEVGLLPTAPAVASALAAFDGYRRTTLPMRDSAAARAVSVGRRPRATR